MSDRSVLADPIASSLAGPHRRFSVNRGRVARYHPDVSVFYAHPRELDEADYQDLRSLAGPSETLSLRDRAGALPSGWTVLETIGLVQYDGSAIESAYDAETVTLTPADVPEMTALVRRTNPGPFLPRTIELGTYLGIRDANGALIAMAGQRLNPPGWVEISAVCTAPEARGRGLASRLIRAVAQDIRDRGQAPFLHTSEDNPARSLYESLGFAHTTTVPLEIVQPGAAL